MIPATHTVLNTGPAISSVFLHVGGGLVLVLLAFIVAVNLYRRVVFTGRGRHVRPMLSVKHSESLGPGQRVVVVEIGEQWLVLGVTAKSISCLSTMEKQENIEASFSPLSARESFHKALLSSVKRYAPGGRK
ncbi:Flagellar protein FliO [Enterobacter sp. DC4]|uniref:flagellar biosynthetic protein FliO n=1 Tax=Enterobacter sp. DC4 TaxID=1395580 RepID=UPI0003ED078A|nr:flagellar biosynthetic protein FliO [Enterobacter sp. DC4]EWG67270.1 Flagellar protein FliO [Enterobacter sp. DC4]